MGQNLSREIPHAIDLKRIGPALIIGRGPSSFKLSPEEIASSFKTVISINHVRKNNIGHFIDYEAFLESGWDVLDCDQVWMPMRPHWRQEPQSGDLRMFMKHDHKLRCLHERGMLRAYDLRSSGEKTFQTYPVIEAYSASTEAVFDILGYMGLVSISSIGIDGGKERAKEFEGSFRMNPDDPTYELQFESLNKICSRHRISWKRL